MIPGIVAAGGSTSSGSPPPSTDYFAANGANYPINGAATWPTAFYDATGETTWFCWEAWDDDEGKRLVGVTTYNHDTEKWSSVVLFTHNLMTDDGHGTPAMVMDHQGYVHIFSGPHNADLIYWVTKRPRDPSQWTPRPDIVGPEGTYPKPILVGSSIFLFFRERITLGSRWAQQVRKTTALDNGVATWGAASSVIDMGDSTRPYLSEAWVVGTDIHLCWTRANADNSIERDAYHGIYDTTDGSFRNSDGSVDTASGSLPIDLTLANASYRVYSHGSDYGGIPAFCIDSAGTLHMVVGHGVSDDNFSLLYLRKATGSAWDSPVTIGPVDGTFTRFHYGMGLVPLPTAGDLELWYANGASEVTFPTGGNAVRRLRTSGSWGSESTILAAGTRGLSRFSNIVNAHANARLFFCENTSTENDADAGDLKLYAHGDSGFLKRFAQAPTNLRLSTTTILEAAGIGDVVGRLFADDADEADTITWTIRADPDNKFDLDGRDLVLTAAPDAAPATHSVTLRATDSFGLRTDVVLVLNVVETVDELTDTFLDDVALLLEGQGPSTGADTHFASVVLLLDGA